MKVSSFNFGRDTWVSAGLALVCRALESFEPGWHRVPSGAELANLLCKLWPLRSWQSLEGIKLNTSLCRSKVEFFISGLFNQHLLLSTRPALSQTQLSQPHVSPPQDS